MFLFSNISSKHLGEEDDIDQVGTECPSNKGFVNVNSEWWGWVWWLLKYLRYSPKTVDGGYCESHEGGHSTHSKDGDSHHPHNLSLTCLKQRPFLKILKIQDFFLGYVWAGPTNQFWWIGNFVHYWPVSDWLANLSQLHYSTNSKPHLIWSTYTLPKDKFVHFNQFKNLRNLRNLKIKKTYTLPEDKFVHVSREHWRSRKNRWVWKLEFCRINM